MHQLVRAARGVWVAQVQHRRAFARRGGVRLVAAFAVWAAPWAPPHVPRLPAPAAVVNPAANDHARAKGDGGLGHIHCGLIPGIQGHRIAKGGSRVVLRDVHSLRLCRLNHDDLRGLFAGLGGVAGRVGHGAHSQLWARFQLPGIASAFAQGLNGAHQARCVLGIGAAQCARPRQIAGHLAQHIGKLGQRFDRRVPSLGVHRIGQCLARHARMLTQPQLCRADLFGVQSASQHLGHEFVGVKRNGGDQLQQHLHRCGSLRRRAGWRIELRIKLNRCTGPAQRRADWRRGFRFAACQQQRQRQRADPRRGWRAG